MRQAILLPVFNRPDTLRQCLKAVCASKGIEDYDLFGMVDVTNEGANGECVQLLKDAGFNAVVRPQPYGLGLNIQSGLHDLFDMEFERVTVLEDDIVVSDTELLLQNRMLDWGAKYDNIGITTVHRTNLGTVEEKAYNLDIVLPCNCAWGVYTIPRTTWDVVGPVSRTYCEEFLTAGDNAGWLYLHRDHTAIRKFFIELLKGAVTTANPTPRCSALPPDHPGEWPTVERLITQLSLPNQVATGQDAMTMIALVTAGLAKVSTWVNRSIDIGPAGTTMRPNRYKELKLDTARLDLFPEDESMTEFTLEQTL